MKRGIMAALIGMFACPVFAETAWISADAFEARVTGRATDVYFDDGTLQGTEYFLANRRVIWQTAGETGCYLGSWRARSNHICFRYEGGFGNCYRYYEDGDKLVSNDWVAGVQTTTLHRLTIVDKLLPTCSKN